MFGLVLYFMATGIVRYGNYNNLGWEVAIQFYFMAFVFTMIAAYLASRDFELISKRSKKQKTGSGLLAALVAAFIPGIFYYILDLTILHNSFILYFFGFQFFFVPVPAE